MKKSHLCLALGASLALSGCMSSPAPRSLPPIQQQQQTSVEGQWIDPNGIVSSFQAGTFTTRTTDTNQLLASGTYTSKAPTMVEINMTSLVRNTQSRVNCALVTSNQLNCTTDSGAQFSLARKAV
ncbi:MAG TPA: outer membrane lipoprotein Omp10 [Rhodocyclaceae bacterium]